MAHSGAPLSRLRLGIRILAESQVNWAFHKENAVSGVKMRQKSCRTDQTDTTMEPGCPPGVTHASRERRLTNSTGHICLGALQTIMQSIWNF